MDALRLVNAKILDLLAKSLSDKPNTKASKEAVNQLRTENAAVRPKNPWLGTPGKGLHMRTESESNRYNIPLPSRIFNRHM